MAKRKESETGQTPIEVAMRSVPTCEPLACAYLVQGFRMFGSVESSVKAADVDSLVLRADGWVSAVKNGKESRIPPANLTHVEMAK
jgi:hypothetical protein